MSAPASACEERFLTFPCEGSHCVGILTLPANATASLPGVVVVVGGPQYRVGSHRQFVLLARSCAEAGIPVLRFDYRGMGDSEGEPRTFEDIDADIRAAVDALCRETGVARVVLWGLCDGASAALIYAATDARVAGVTALNPWARSEQGEAVTRLRHYYVRRVLAGDFWRKIVSGRFRPAASAGHLAATLRTAAQAGARAGFLERMEAGWRAFAGPVLFLLSGRDLTAREFESWAGATPRRRALFCAARVVSFAQADHTFSDRASRDAAAAATLEWIGRIDGGR